jgi:hypothetical protein
VAVQALDEEAQQADRLVGVASGGDRDAVCEPEQTTSGRWTWPPSTPG